MPGYVQTLEGLQGLIDDGFANLGASEPPAVITAMIASIAQEPDVKKWLRELGRYIAKKGIGELTGSILGRPNPPNPWMDQLVGPLLKEVENGAIDELKRRARPWAWGLAAITGLAGVGLGALIAGRKRRLYERARREVVAPR